MRQNSTLRKKGGFTLIELMIVVFIVGVLAAIAIPAFVKARSNARSTSFASDIRTLAYAADSYALETGLYAPQTSPGVFPAGLEGYISKAMFESETPLGGNWHIEFDTSNFYSGVGVSNPAYTASDFAKVDAIIDDGDISTGQFRAVGNGYYLIVEEL